MGNVLPNASENVLNAEYFLREVGDLYKSLLVAPVFKILLGE